MIRGKYEDSTGMTTRLGGTENELYLMTVRVEVDDFERDDFEEPYFHEPLVIMTQDEYDEMQGPFTCCPHCKSERDKLAAQVQRVREVVKQYDADADYDPYGGELWSTTAAELNAALNGEPA